MTISFHVDQAGKENLMKETIFAMDASVLLMPAHVPL